MQCLKTPQKITIQYPKLKTKQVTHKQIYLCPTSTMGMSLFTASKFAAGLETPQVSTSLVHFKWRLRGWVEKTCFLLRLQVQKFPPKLSGPYKNMGT